MEEIKSAVSAVAAATAESRRRVSVEYREDAEGGQPWIVHVTYTQQSSRKGYTSTVEGYGETPTAAAEDAIETYHRAVARGIVRTSDDYAPPPPSFRCVCGHRAADADTLRAHIVESFRAGNTAHLPVEASR
jgi:hypothetical protein